MKQSNRKALWIVAIWGGIALASGGCSGLAGATLRPERLFQQRPGMEVAYEEVGDLSLVRRSWALFGFPLSKPNLVASVETEIQKASADAVANLEVASSTKMYMFLFGFTEYRVTGDLLVFER